MWSGFAMRVLCPVEMEGVVWGNKRIAFSLQ